MWRGHGGCPAESWAGAGVGNRRRQVAPRLHWQCRASVQTMQSLNALWTATRMATRMQRGAEQCRSASGMSSSSDPVHSFSAAHSIQLRQLPITMTTTKTTRLYSDAGWQQKITNHSCREDPGRGQRKYMDRTGRTCTCTLVLRTLLVRT